MTRRHPLGTRLIGIYALLCAINIGAWIWAFIAFRGQSTLLGVGLVVFGFGLRHAVDADHIAAIDNVTRKLMQRGHRPVTVGFFFAAGHSTVVFIAAATIAGAAGIFASIQALRAVGGIISTIISAGFLIAIAAMNITILAELRQTWGHLQAGASYAEIAPPLESRGVLSWILRPMFRLVSKSWHMFPLGFLFGLGFDTATEVAMFAISATQLSHGVPFSSILVFPALFAAGMMLVDTADGVVMLRAYDWAFIKPIRKVFYNMIITLISIVSAIVIAGIEVLNLIGDALHFKGEIRDAIAVMYNHFNELGFAIIGIFLLVWALSFLIYKANKSDPVDGAVT